MLNDDLSFDLPSDIEEHEFKIESSVKCQSIYGWLFQRAFVSDYLGLVFLAVLCGLTEIPGPFETPIDASVLNNPDFAHPHKPDIVPSWALFLIALLGPFVWTLAIQLFALRLSPEPQRTIILIRKMHRYLLALLTTLALTLSTTNLLKITVGRLRPDFLDRCKYSNITNQCSGDPILVKEGRESFPSGHSSFAFAGLVLTSLWGVQVLRLWEFRGREENGVRKSMSREGYYAQISAVQNGDLEMNGNATSAGATLGGMSNSDASSRIIENERLIHSPLGLPKATLLGSSRMMVGWIPIVVVALLPVWVAAYVAVTRLQQFVHHPTDVIAGSLLGTFFASVINYIHFGRWLV